VDILGVVRNLRVCLPAPGPGVSVEKMGLLEMAVSPLSMTSETSKVALKAGSSKQGRRGARRWIQTA
jgi:hypothetical protein